jgi:uncharacterized protein YqcC (DUF446 family)
VLSLKADKERFVMTFHVALPRRDPKYRRLLKRRATMTVNSAHRSEAVLAKLDAIEAEMKRIGYWSESPPDLQAEIRAGMLRSFIDAPSFELWLQCVFIPNARAVATRNDLPKESQVGVMAMRQYDYHSHIPAAQKLLELLSDFDAIVEGPA